MTSTNDDDFLFVGPALQFLETGQVGKGGTVKVGTWGIKVAENKLNPRQLDFLSLPITNWVLVQLTVQNFKRYGHLYQIGLPGGSGRLLINCFAGEPMGFTTRCGDHTLVMIQCDNVEAIERKAKKAVFGSNVKLTGELEVWVRSVSEPRVVVPVGISTVGDADTAVQTSEFVAARASKGRGVPRAWPAELTPGTQRIEFPKAQTNGD